MLLARKLQNAIKKVNNTCTFKLKNIVVNEEKRGCSGFVSVNNVHVYINTERCAYHGVSNYMYRYADSTSDYRGYHNRWADTLEELVAGVDKLLRSNPVAERDFRL